MEAIKVSMELSHSVYQCPNTDIIHLVFVENVEIISGCKEESFKEITPDNLLLLKESTLNIVRTKATRNVEYHQPQKRYNVHFQSRGVILSYLLKGKPPDTPPTPKPKQYQGKALQSQKRMRADLLYLGAGYTVRSQNFVKREGMLWSRNPWFNQSLT